MFERLYDDTSEADCEDIGVEDLGLDFEEVLDSVRELRLYNLIGRFVIICDSRYDKGKVLFLQDRTISKRRWTLFSSNALGFKSLDKAQDVCCRFQYNNPRVMKLTKKGLVGV